MFHNLHCVNAVRIELSKTTAVATTEITINTSSCQSGSRAPDGKRHIWSIVSTASVRPSCATAT
jgi:hypothetical protein